MLTREMDNDPKVVFGPAFARQKSRNWHVLAEVIQARAAGRLSARESRSRLLTFEFNSPVSFWSLDD